MMGVLLRASLIQFSVFGKSLGLLLLTNLGGVLASWFASRHRQGFDVDAF